VDRADGIYDELVGGNSGETTGEVSGEVSGEVFD
jgi:hypothetical protein